ncbi:MAG: hypothetical protein GQ569_06930 [Methylococcaceae bacterium]|nr:hypothetical protein [Methylococcaceae bacterium]
MINKKQLVDIENVSSLSVCVPKQSLRTRQNQVTPTPLIRDPIDSSEPIDLS